MRAQLSREDLHEIAYQGSFNELERNLARMLLAGMCSEPFGFAHNFETFEDDTVRISKEQNRHYGKPLYAAPPAPVAVPDELNAAIRQLKDTLVACNRYNYCSESVKRIEEACRAAMLKAGPVTAATGWIKCRERMPDAGSEQRVCAYTPSPHIDVRFRMVKASMFKQVCCDATHWQYMAAPEQEV